MKNKQVIEILRQNCIDITINAESRVVANDYAESLPTEIGRALSEIQYLAKSQRKNDSAERGKDPLPNSVFLVHGGDQSTYQMTARFLEKLGLNLIILNEIPDAYSNSYQDSLCPIQNQYIFAR